MNPNIKNFEKRLKIKIKNKSLLIDALTHKSANHEINNERLEFLGDRVIDSHKGNFHHWQPFARD